MPSTGDATSNGMITIGGGGASLALPPSPHGMKIARSVEDTPWPAPAQPMETGGPSATISFLCRTTGTGTCTSRPLTTSATTKRETL